MDFQVNGNPARGAAHVEPAFFPPRVHYLNTVALKADELRRQFNRATLAGGLEAHARSFLERSQFFPCLDGAQGRSTALDAKPCRKPGGAFLANVKSETSKTRPGIFHVKALAGID